MAIGLISKLESRRQQLGMSCAEVAARSGLGLRTVQRILTGSANPELSTLEKLAHAMSATVGFDLLGPDPDIVRQAQAQRKAAQLVSLTQGTSALEAQAVSQDALNRMKEQTAMRLLCGSRRRLWAEP